MILRGSQVFHSGLIELKHTDFLSSIKRENMERPRYAIWTRLRSRKRRKYQNYKYMQLDSIQLHSYRELLGDENADGVDPEEEDTAGETDPADEESGVTTEEAGGDLEHLSHQSTGEDHDQS